MTFKAWWREFTCDHAWIYVTGLGPKQGRRTARECLDCGRREKRWVRWWYRVEKW